jgi:hypothetical protein
MLPIGSASCQDTCLHCRCKLIIMFVFSSVCFVCLYINMWLSLLQAWIYQHFRGIGSKDARGGYRGEYPRPMLFAPRMGLSTPDEYRKHMDMLDLSAVVMTPYVEHRVSCPFDRVSLYFGWLRYGNRMVKYLPERVLRQFRYVQTIPTHPLESAPPQQTLGEMIFEQPFL